ncbi:hypothetical protein HDU98_011345 [Podochytrium sp. JEL0797]|nr:hypothetical protein HDU98_011345 [Podochytrium sp. JEL0797]
MNLSNGRNDAISASALLASVYPLDSDHPSQSTHPIEGLGSDPFRVLSAHDKSASPALARNNEVISISSSPVHQASPLGNVITLYSEASSPVSDVVVPEETVEEVEVALSSPLEMDARYQHAVLLAYTLKRRLAYAAYKVQNGWEHESFENVRKWTDEKYDKLSDYKKKKAAVLAKKKLALFVDADRLSGGKSAVIGKAKIDASQKSSPISNSLAKHGISKKAARAGSVVEDHADWLSGSRKKAKSEASNESNVASQKSSPVCDSSAKHGVSKISAHASSVVEEHADRLSRRKSKSEASNESVGKAKIIASQKLIPVRDLPANHGISINVARASSVVEEHADRLVTLGPLITRADLAVLDDLILLDHNDMILSLLDDSVAATKKVTSSSPSQPVHQKPASVPTHPIQLQQQRPSVAVPPRNSQAVSTAQFPAQQQRQSQPPSSSPYNQLPVSLETPPRSQVIYDFQALQFQSRPLGPPAPYPQDPRNNSQLNATWLTQGGPGPYNDNLAGAGNNYPPSYLQPYPPSASAGYPASYQLSPYANPHELASPYDIGYNYQPSQYRPDPRGAPQPSPYTLNPPSSSQPSPSAVPYGQPPNGGGSGMLFSQGGGGGVSSGRLFSSDAGSYPPLQTYPQYAPRPRPTHDPIRDFRNAYGASVPPSGQYQQLPPPPPLGQGYRR